MLLSVVNVQTDRLSTIQLKVAKEISQSKYDLLANLFITWNNLRLNLLLSCSLSRLIKMLSIHFGCTHSADNGLRVRGKSTKKKMFLYFFNSVVSLRAVNAIIIKIQFSQWIKRSKKQDSYTISQFSSGRHLASQCILCPVGPFSCSVLWPGP